MPGPAVATLQRFGAVEDDQKYTRLVELFAPDAVYYDPFFGPQRGLDAIRDFMGHMEQVVPASGATFRDWHVEADRVVGWATWVMEVTTADGVADVAGQSLYRLNDRGQVTFVTDYLDPRAYQALRGDAKRPDLVAATGLSASPDNAAGPALEVVQRFWAVQEAGRYSELAELFTDDAVFTDAVYGRMEGRDAIAGYLRRMQAEMPTLGARFELVDAAGDETAAWSQWWCHLPNGTVPGWTLHTVRDGRFTLDADFFDTVAARTMTRAGD
jgi:ketosteroid isomerase-like protein